MPKLYYLKTTLTNFLNLNPKIKYTLDQLALEINNTILSSKQIKKYFPDFKTCNCTSTNCKVNMNDFYEYAKMNLIIDDGLPECSFYFSSYEKPHTIDIDSFTFI